MTVSTAFHGSLTGLLGSIDGAFNGARTEPVRPDGGKAAESSHHTGKG